jgi:hypothetical protein
MSPRVQSKYFILAVGSFCPINSFFERYLNCFATGTAFVFSNPKVLCQYLRFVTYS